MKKFARCVLILIFVTLSAVPAVFLRRQDIDNDVYLNNTALCSTGRGK